MTRKSEQRDESWEYLAPRDLRAHHLPSQAALGFHRGQTEMLLNRAADTIERLNRELAELQQTRETWKRERDRLEGQLEEAQTRAELLVGEAMLDAHKATQALKAEAEAEAAAVRAAAEALLEPAGREAARLVAEARDEANQLVAAAQAECDRLGDEAEQYKLLAADVQRRSIEFLRQGLEALGPETADAEKAAGEDVRPFRSSERDAAAE
jgi:cell division septum initiation protein DivIVA